MTWFPIGPNSVFGPRNPNFTRLSRRNERGEQGQVQSIAFDPTDPTGDMMYVTCTPHSGGASAFASSDGGGLWSCISLGLHQATTPGPAAAPCCIAVNPIIPSTVYMGDLNSNVYISHDYGATWPTVSPLADGIFKMIVDPRTAADPARTTILAAGGNGLYLSTTSGMEWHQVIPDDMLSLAAYMPASGSDQYYAGGATGLYKAENPAGPWINLNKLGIGLPDPATLGVPMVAALVDYCPANPAQVYVWMANPNSTIGLFASSDSGGSWTKVNTGPLPAPYQGITALACYLFAVAPNSPGDGKTDILFFGEQFLHRSIDGGKSWVQDANYFHQDQHALAFANPTGGAVPRIYVGCDGGLAMSDVFCDRNFTQAAFSSQLQTGDYNETANLTNACPYQSLNHGLQNPAIYSYCSNPAISALSYIGCQDTGIAGGSGALGWRTIDGDFDALQVVMAPSWNGVTVWSLASESPVISVYTDKGGLTTYPVDVMLGTNGPALTVDDGCSLATDLSGNCLATFLGFTELLAAPINAGMQSASPSAPGTLANIQVGMQVAMVDVSSGAIIETVTVSEPITATSFTADFAQPHQMGEAMRFQSSFVGRIDPNGVVAQISGQLPFNGSVIATHPTDPDIIYCANGFLNQVFFTTSGTTASPATIWTEAAANKPSGRLNIVSIAIDPAGNVYVLLQFMQTVGAVETPLFQITSQGTWVPQPWIPPVLDIENLPTDDFPGFRALRADPVTPNTLYLAYHARVFRLTLIDGVWDGSDITDNLPGQWVYDLWIGNIGSAAEPKVLLRAAIPTCGVWEMDVASMTEASPSIALYLRDNLLDQGWLAHSPDGVPNPYNPGSILHHYSCADIKVDYRQPATASTAAYFQTTAEYPLPITGVVFDQLAENSMNLPGANQALVHVQVHNRSNIPADYIQVWAIYCNAAAGLPGLNVSASHGNAFDFWSQFAASGAIMPNLPADSPWTSLGPVQTLFGVSAQTPRVASWAWHVPGLGTNDPGNYCIVAFVHCAASPIVGSAIDVDALTPINRQVGQKMPVGAPL